jgi:hypothetical protein
VLLLQRLAGKPASLIWAVDHFRIWDSDKRRPKKLNLKTEAVACNGF